VTRAEVRVERELHHRDQVILIGGVAQHQRHQIRVEQEVQQHEEHADARQRETARVTGQPHHLVLHGHRE
jgi:hypothetical protein